MDDLIKCSTVRQLLLGCAASEYIEWFSNSAFRKYCCKLIAEQLVSYLPVVRLDVKRVW